jgi:glycosyltransferase involved in cell wall biosynthesis
MKIDILTPIRFGGPQKWGDDLVRALEKEGIEARNIHNFLGIIKRFFYTDADIIHSTLPLFFNLQGKPIILTIHGNYKKENIWKYLYPLAMKRANAITTPSNFLKEQLNLEKAIVIPNGIFPEDYKQIKQVKHRKNKPIQIVTVTGFKFWDKARGVLKLFKILQEVKNKTKKKFVFTVVGNGPYLEKIKNESKKYDVPIKFIGFHSNPKDILQKSDIFVYYSYLDNLPITILEAMASGLPIVANDVGAIGEMIKASKDDSEFEKEVISLLNNKKIKKDKNNKNIDNYYWSNINYKFKNIYNDTKYKI